MTIGRAPRGEFEVRGKHPHMWALAVVAMGFSVRQMRWEDQSFGDLMKGYGIRGQSLPFYKIRRRSLYRIDVVFCDKVSLGLLDDEGRNGGRLLYWDHPRCPHHVFHCPEGSDTPPHNGWTAFKITVSHRHVGGSTDAVWSLVL